MYSRNYYGGARFSPPPGYVGNAFDSPTVKHHEPEYTEPTSVRREESEENQDASETQTARENLTPVPQENTNVLGELIRSLSGRIGREELIILLVMLLTASDGVSAETLILALVLLSGK